MLWDILSELPGNKKNRRCAIANSSYGTSPIMCLILGIMEISHPPYIPLVDAIVTWMFRNRQDAKTKVIVF